VEAAETLWSIDFRIRPQLASRQFRSANIVGHNNGNIVGNVGIESTPVIDLSSNTLYLVARTMEVSGIGRRITSRACTPSTSQMGVKNCGLPSAYRPSQLSSILSTHSIKIKDQVWPLANGMVLFSWASHEDLNVWYGWIMAYNAQTLLAVERVLHDSSGLCGREFGCQAGHLPVDSGVGNVLLRFR